MSESNYANGFNTNDLSNQNSKGLAWKCNEMNNAVYDLYDYVISPNPPVGAGVKLLQGSASISAGNEFSSNITGGGLAYGRHINQLDPNQMLYYHSSGNQQPIQLTGNVSPIISSNNTCPSSFQYVGDGSTSKMLTNENRNAIENELADLNEMILSKSATLNSLLENGNKLELHNSVSNLSLSNRQLVKSSLLENSPYLSKELIEELGEIDPAIFPHDWYRDIIIANISVAYSVDFIEMLSTKAYPIPDNYINEIKSSLTDINERVEIETFISAKIEEKDRLENLLVGTSLG